MNDDSLEEKWRRLRNELYDLFRERDLSYPQAAERYELDLHEDELDYEFNYERVKKFWRKPPKEGSSLLEQQKDCPAPSRLAAAADYLERLHNYILEDGTTVVGKKNCDSKRWIQKKMGMAFWNEFNRVVVKRVEKEESDEEW
ncbi:MAG: hypothetical protein MJZ22_02830 [Candidatus Saccharibacteria bacterium]|nr:hypothetical protein [Candidatus Saccharibacteria bacterium]